MARVHEEAGVEVSDVRRVSAQPWPFPTSLMPGFFARYERGTSQPLDGELADVRWVPIPELARAARNPLTDLTLPPPMSIARALIDEWVRPGNLDH
ncbi:MAG: NUDIX domain-containing protein [Solirubrobacteraceae bacterium]